MVKFGLVRSKLVSTVQIWFGLVKVGVIWLCLMQFRQSKETNKYNSYVVYEFVFRKDKKKYISVLKSLRNQKICWITYCTAN